MEGLGFEVGDFRRTCTLDLAKQSTEWPNMIPIAYSHAENDCQNARRPRDPKPLSSR